MSGVRLAFVPRTKTTEKRVRRLVEKWRKLFGISPTWEITIDVYETEDDTPDDDREDVACARNESAYRRSNLSFNLWEPECKNDLERAVIHEMLHLLLDRYEIVVDDALKRTPNYAKELKESTVTALEHAFKRVLR